MHIKAIMENEWHRKAFQSFRNYDNSQNINFVGLQIDTHSRSESQNEKSDQKTCCRDRAVVYRLKSRNIVNTY